LPSLWYRLLYSYVNSLRTTKLAHYNRILRLIASLSPLKVVVDVGAGYGIVSDLIHKEVEILLLIEKDTALSGELARKKREIKNVEVILADAHNLPLTEEYADLVYFHDSFDEIGNKTRALLEAARIVRREGYLAVLDWDGARLLTRIKEVLLQKTGFPVKCWSLEETKRVIKKIGLKVIIAQSNFGGSMIILAKKPRLSNGGYRIHVERDHDKECSAI